MELDLERIWEKFLLFSGEDAGGWEPGREELCRLFCAECGEQTQRQVREAAEAESFRGALESLAAAEAFVRLVLADEALTPESIGLPEVNWEAGDRAEKARRLAAEQRKACAGALRERDFYFGRA